MSILTETRTTFRSLRRAPAFTLLAVAILTTGIALTLYMFGAINGFVLRPLPYRDAGRLVHLEFTSEAGTDEVPTGDYFRLREALTTIPDLAAFYSATVNLGGQGEPERLEGEFVSSNLFSVLGVRPAMGRGFDAGDEAAGAPRVAVISNELWQRRFGGDPGVVGSFVRLNSEPATIVGVMAPGFDFPEKQEVWLPVRRDAEAFDRQRAATAEVTGHLAPGATISAARAEIDALVARLAAEDSGLPKELRAVVKPLALEFVGRQTRITIEVMFVAVLLVLLIACADVANLLMVRGLGRQKDIAVRAALGASRRTLLVRGLLEGGLVATVASVVGLALAQWGGVRTMQMLRANDDMSIPSWVHFDIDGTSVAFTVAIALLSTLAAALGPALATSRPKLVAGLRQSGRGAIGGLSRSSRWLVAAQIALSVALVASAGIGARSVGLVSERPLGVEADQILGARIGLFEGNYPDDASRVAFFRRAEERLRAIPGVEAATVTTSLPASFIGGRPLEVEGIAVADLGGRRGEVARVSPSYFETMGMPIVSGRGLTAGDGATSEPVTLVNQRLAHVVFRDQNPVGRRIRFAGRGEPGPWMRIVGVVPDVLQNNPEDGIQPTLYAPIAQEVPRFAFLAVRGSGDVRSLAPELRRAVTSIDPDQPVYWVRTVAEWAEINGFNARFLASLFALFAIAGLLLAGAGVYAVVGYTVVSRTGEIGIRRALGARDSGIVGWIFRGSARDLAIGLAVGAVLAAGMTRPVAGIFRGVSVFDPLTWVALPLVLAAATALACLAPTLRALRVDPATALRAE